MKYIDIMPSAEAIRVSLTCDKCGNRFETSEMMLPYPNYAADNQSESEREEEYGKICPHCGKEFIFDVFNGIGGGTVVINNLDEKNDAECYEIYYEDYIEEEIIEFCKAKPEASYHFFSQSITDTRKAISELTRLSPDVRQIYIRLLYAHMVGCMEAYLSFTFKQIIFNYPKYKRLFVESFKDFNNESFPLNKIYERMDELDTKIVKALNDLMYHKLAKIQSIYRSTLGVGFGDIGSLCKKIEVRHHIVHRNGKDKEGNPITISYDDLMTLVDEVEKFVNNIKQQIDKIDFK